MLLTNFIDQVTANRIIFSFEIISLIIAIIMIIVGIFQVKEFQTGLAALNGGNDELFANSKERGKQKTFSIIMLSLGTTLTVIVSICLILTNTIIVSS